MLRVENHHRIRQRMVEKYVFSDKIRFYWGKGQVLFEGLS